MHYHVNKWWGVQSQSLPFMLHPPRAALWVHTFQILLYVHPAAWRKNKRFGDSCDWLADREKKAIQLKLDNKRLENNSLVHVFTQGYLALGFSGSCESLHPVLRGRLA